MAEHTPGQWTVHWHTAQGGDGHWIMDAKDCGELSRLAMVVFHDDESANETRANARLIAAAPALLAALKRLVEHSASGADYDAIGEACRVIDQAEWRVE